MRAQVVDKGQVSVPNKTQNFDENIPLPRESHSSILHDDKIIVFGGRTFSTKRTKNFLNDVWSFSLLNHQWECLIPSTTPEDDTRPVRRQNQTAVKYNDKIIIYGGQTDDERYLDDIWSFDLSSHTWEHVVTDHNPDARHSHSAVMWGSKMVIFGGRDSHKEAHYSNDIYYLDINEKKWSKMECSGPIPSGRSYHRASLLNSGNHMLVFGGYFWDGRETYYNDVHVLDMKNQTWVNVTVKGNSAPMRNRHMQQAVSSENDKDTDIIIYGGNYLTYEDMRDVFYNDAYKMSVSETNNGFKCAWNKLQTSGTCPKRGNQSSVYYPRDGCVYMIGGELSRRRFSDVIRFEL
jgi:N-acetylneuraminic acid mutarotase